MLKEKFKHFNKLGLTTAKAYKDTVSLAFCAEYGIKKPFQQSANPNQNNQPKTSD